jgi:hypothetical protein
MRLFRRSSSALSRRAEWLYVFFCTCFVVGLFLDGWAHNHVPELETFFTPWHAVFYAGYACMALTLAAFRLRMPKGLPAGYREAAIGAVVFAFGGVGDMLWHEAFGIEKDIEALFSPTHLVLAVGTVLMLSAPYLAVLRAGESAATFVGRLPAILALTYAASAVMFLTQFDHWSDLRLVGDLPTRQTAELREALAMAGYIWHVAVLMAAAILLLRAMPPALGTLTILFAVSTFGMAVMRQPLFLDAFPLVCIAYVAGFFADLWAEKLRPIDTHLARFRWFTAGVPAALIALLHGYAIPLHGTWWSVQMWTGAVAIAACVGLLVGLAMVPPARD